MESLFGISSSVATVAVASLYLLISLHTSVYGIKNFQEFLSEEHKPKHYLLINTETNIFHISSLILSVSCLISSILLIVGVIEKRHIILRPWLLFNFALEFLLSNSFFYLIFLLAQAYRSSSLNACGVLVAAFINILALIFHEYIYNGVDSLYQKFESESRNSYRDINSEHSEEDNVV